MPLRARAEVVLQVVDVGADRLDGLGGSVGEVGQQVQVVDRSRTPAAGRCR